MINPLKQMIHEADKQQTTLEEIEKEYYHARMLRCAVIWYMIMATIAILGIAVLNIVYL